MMATKKIIMGPTGDRSRHRIAELRSRRRLTLAQLAARLTELGHPMQTTALSRIEQGERRVDVDDLVALALALEVTPNALLLPESTLPEVQVMLTPSCTKDAAAAWEWACDDGSPTDNELTTFKARLQALEEELARVSNIVEPIHRQIIGGTEDATSGSH